MQQTNVHQQKLYALVEAGFGLVGLILTWYTSSVEGTTQKVAQNGFEDWGWLSLAGVAVVVFYSFLTGDKTKPYDDNSKKLVLVAFAAIAVGAIITLTRLSQSSGQFQAANGMVITVKTVAGPGLWMTLVAGVLGLAWVSGILNKLSTPSTPAAPPPPPAAPLV